MDAVMRKELLDSLQNKWLTAFAIVFFLLVIQAPYLVLYYNTFNADRFLEAVVLTFVAIEIPLVPVMSFSLGSVSVVGEREKGTLQYLLTEPVSKMEIFFGKFLGLLLSTSLAILVGFGAAGFMVFGLRTFQDPDPRAVRLIFSSGNEGVIPYTTFVALVLALSIASLALSFLISVSTRRRVLAFAAGLFLWFFFATIYDLAAVGTVLAVGSSDPFYLVPLMALNPIAVVRTLIFLIAYKGYIAGLGPGGLYVDSKLGSDVAGLMLLGIIFAWILVPLVIAAVIFRRQEVI